MIVIFDSLILYERRHNMKNAKGTTKNCLRIFYRNYFSNQELSQDCVQLEP